MIYTTNGGKYIYCRGYVCLLIKYCIYNKQTSNICINTMKL